MTGTSRARNGSDVATAPSTGSASSPKTRGAPRSRRAFSVACGLGSHFAGCHGRRQLGIRAMPSGRPMLGPMTPGIELAERVEEAQILVIVHAGEIFANRTAQRHDA